MAINFNRVPRYIRAEIDPPDDPISKGAGGVRVKRIQEWLNIHRCHTAIDQDFGPATAACVEDFQRQNSIRITGIVDTKTWGTLVKPMTSALQAPAELKHLSAAESVLVVATQHVEQHPVEIGGANCGPWVRLYCDGKEGPAWAWCAGFVTLIMKQAYFYRDAKPPIEGSVSCDTLAAQSKNAGLFVAERKLTSGQIEWKELGGCCLFLRRRTTTDWTHTGFASTASGEAEELVFNTIEGNTNDEGSREGFEACRRRRSLSKSHYDFVKFE